MALRLPRLRINRLWLLLGGAIVMGLLAAWLSVNYLKSREKRMEADLAERAKGGPTVSVVVPTRDSPRGTVVSGAVMAARDITADLLYEDVITADDFKAVDGKRLIKPVLKGRPLRRSDVYDERFKDLSTNLDPGRRALTIDIDETNSFALMLRPGNFIDLYLIAQNPGGATPGQEIRPLLPRVKVMATGQTLKGGEPEQIPGQPARQVSYSNVTIDVSPFEAARIALAQQVGKIRAVLRNADDDKALDFDQLAAAALFRPLDGRGPPSVEYIVGGKSGGSGATAPVNITMPNINFPGMAPAGAPGASYSPSQSGAFSAMPASINAGIPAVPTGAAR